MSYQSVAVAKVYRGQAVESVHWGSAALADADGRLLYRVGDPYLMTFMRSSAKPFQAIPVVESGAAKKFVTIAALKRTRPNVGVVLHGSWWMVAGSWLCVMRDE